MIKFSYPSAAAPTVEVTLPDREELPYARGTRGLQAAFETDAGADVIYDWGDAVSVFTVTLWPITIADSALLRDFLETTVNYRAEAFDFTDSLGDVYRVRLAQDVVDPQRPNNIHERWQLSLKVQP